MHFTSITSVSNCEAYDSSFKRVRFLWSAHTTLLNDANFLTNPNQANPRQGWQEVVIATHGLFNRFPHCHLPKHGNVDVMRLWCTSRTIHDDVIKWKKFPRNWPFVWGIHRSPVNSPRKGQWRGALMFDLCLNKRMSKQWWGWWFQTPLCPLWRHCNAVYMIAR